MEMDGPLVWVPRTVPYLDARRVAQAANQNGDRLRYLGKRDALLLGFTHDCLCEEVCQRAYKDDLDYEPTGDRTCYVPSWAFELVESWR